MASHRFTLFFLALGLLGLGTTASADGGSSQEKSLFERIDDFGKSILVNILPAERTKESKEKSSAALKGESGPYVRKTVPAQPSETAAKNGTRAGSILSGDSPTPGVAAARTSGRAKSEYRPEDASSAAAGNGSTLAKPVRREPVERASLDDMVPSVISARKAPAASGLAAADSLIQPSGITDTQQPAVRPLYERLSASRRSLFLKEEPIAQPTVPTARGDNGVPAGPSVKPTADASASKETSHDAEGAVLFSRKSPILSVETLGPRKIAVGKESAYEVSIVNSGEIAAEELVVFVSLPEWTEVLATDPTAGNTMAATGENGTVAWRIGRLTAKGRERLVLRIIPHQSKPFDLVVRWEMKPAASQAIIEVQEPKLALQLDGPREVLYGKKETYRLKIVNNGTGSAENVSLRLMPLGAGESLTASHKIGALAAGEEKTLDVELTARQAGNLTIQVDVRADGGIHAEMVENVLVRRAGLKLDVTAPGMQFVGQQVTYAVRMSNPGTATAKSIRCAATLPAGAKYLSGIENAKLDATGAKLEWSMEQLGPEAEQSFTLRCSLGTAGTNRLEVVASADDDLNVVAVANTRVESVANLVMDVKDPAGPVALGEDAVYEVLVRNRGTKEAENVEVFSYFSRGIEPVAAEGAPNRIASGQVVFLPIPSIAAGAEMVLTVRARADVAGNHVFRAEAHCKSLGTRLVSEATNLYYADVSAGQQVAEQTPADRPGADKMVADKAGIAGSSPNVTPPGNLSPQAELTPSTP